MSATLERRPGLVRGYGTLSRPLKLTLSSANVTIPWQAFMPYLGLLPASFGENDFYAVPMLFVYNFPVKQFNPIPFFVVY